MAGHNCGFIKASDHRPCEVFVGPFGPGGEHALCGIHTPIKARLPPLIVGGCEHVIGNHWCTRQAAAGERLCPSHVLVRQQQAVVRVAVMERQNRDREAARAEARAADAAQREIWRQEGERVRLRAIEAMNRLDPIANPPAARRWVDVNGVGVEVNAALPPPPAPQRPVGLERIARDPQNIHTTAVVRHTNAGEEKLLAVRTDGRSVGLRVLRSFAARGGTLGGVLRVANDVEQWYNRGTCRTAGDRLYARCLEGLWTLIEQQPDKVRAELKARLWEEASESVGMCCEGHIARLVNVMAGFDESFRPRVSVGEAIQTKIAEIAKMGVPTEDKVARARAYLTELAISAEEQAPWLEALE